MERAKQRAVSGVTVRQQDIASHLGISTYTVSMALRNAPSVAEETRRQVQEAARTLGYSQRGRTTGGSGALRQIAFITVFELNDLFYARVLKGAADECQSHELALQYVPLKGSDIQTLPSHHDADALLLVGQIEQPQIRRFAQLGLPLVLVDNVAEGITADRVLIENMGSIRSAVRQLVAWGHQRIAFIRGPEITFSFRERYLGYRLALAEHGLEPIELSCESASLPLAEATISRWLDTHGAPAFTALIGCNDEVAIGAIHALEQHGLSVPGDVSVVGFDDIDLAGSIRPALTTCHVDRELLGRIAVRRLLERAQEPDARTRAITLDTSLVERSSAGPVRPGTSSPS